LTLAASVFGVKISKEVVPQRPFFTIAELKLYDIAHLSLQLVINERFVVDRGHAFSLFDDLSSNCSSHVARMRLVQVIDDFVAPTQQIVAVIDGINDKVMSAWWQHYLLLAIDEFGSRVSIKETFGIIDVLIKLQVGCDDDSGQAGIMHYISVAPPTDRRGARVTRLLV
jgi:hypothetical protein